MTSVPNDYFLYNVRYTPLDSVNLAFKGFSDAQDVINTILSSGAGWSSRTIQAHQYLLDDTAPPTLKIEVGFAVKAISRGLVRMNHLWRFHVRVWQHQGLVVGAAHEEGPGLLTHNVISFDAGRQEVANLFAGLRCTIEPAYLNTNTRILRPLCDGDVTLIRR